ncbi:hypothetical protein PPERSA_03147 [Pseudocohnilembus persalinus]|uniref:Uncharacterized protein n=1 Tax=Pseudocohnilembus persalinus TaxID=266149 RepID=A0A0V0QJ58_PSEPJ|nr:hypothetical protein PPERSA_03147 [Pseudocohnilembus persalinus]|eukprot:KRX02085.1 hypothetical protein PPERSA_03147 [Pseudocohnilembus persalinus]
MTQEFFYLLNLPESIVNQNQNSLIKQDQFYQQILQEQKAQKAQIFSFLPQQIEEITQQIYQHYQIQAGDLILQGISYDQTFIFNKNFSFISVYYLHKYLDQKIKDNELIYYNQNSLIILRHHYQILQCILILEEPLVSLVYQDQFQFSYDSNSILQKTKNQQEEIQEKNKLTNLIEQLKYQVDQLLPFKKFQY